MANSKGKTQTKGKRGEGGGGRGDGYPIVSIGVRSVACHDIVQRHSTGLESASGFGVISAT